MKISKITISIMLLVVILWAPMLVHSADLPLSVKQLISDAKKATMSVSMEQFKVLYDKKEVGLLIDVRDGEEYVTGHVAGAVNVSRGTLEFQIWKLVGGSEKPNYNTKMMLYCGSGARCALAAKTLVDLGFANVTAIDMKLADWKKAGYPFEAAQ